MEIILFYSMHSKKCQSVMSLIRQNNIDVKTVCIDSKEIRDKIKNGTLFQVKGVPMILVVYGEEAEAYEGEQVMQWFDQLLQSKSNNSQNFDDYDDYQDSQPSYEPQIQNLISYKPKRNSKEKQMDSVKDIAKQMENERKRMMPDEDTLPHYS